MSSLKEQALPLRPEVAHIRDSLAQCQPAMSSKITSTSHTTHSAREKARRRNRVIEGASDMILTRKPVHEPTVKNLEDLFVNHFKTQAVEYGEDTSCVFLLWGQLSTSQTSTCSVTKAMEIPIEDSALAPDGKILEDKVFRAMSSTFYSRTSTWASRLGLRTVSAVRQIKFRLIKLHESGLLVNPSVVDLSEDRESCRTSMAEISNSFTGDPEDFCYPDPGNGGKFTHTHPKCEIFADSWANYDPVCPFEAWDSWNSRMKWIDAADFLTCYFMYPDAAKDQVILSGSFGENFLYKYKNIMSRDLRERRFLVLNGLYIEEQWRTPRLVASVIVVLFITCVVSRLVWKDWEIVFGAASFVAAAMTLVYAIHDG